MEEFIRLLAEASPAVAVLLITFVVIRLVGRQADSNSRQADAVQGNMTAVITLSSKISDNSDRITEAVEKLAVLTEAALTTIVTSLKTAEAKALVDEDARAKSAKDINTQLTNITAVLNALTDQCRTLATKEDIFNLSGTLDVLNAISETLAEIKVKLGNNA